jgi:glycosyltransferase involved in cell wall biosynthesis
VSYGYGTEKSLADVLNRMDRQKYEIHILPLFKNSTNRIFREDIRILDALIDYTAEDFDEQAALEKYYSLLASPLLFHKRLEEYYDCVIACNHNAPSYFASYLSCKKKLLWIRGDMRELDYRQFAPDSNQYRQTKQEFEMQKRVLKAFDGIAVISEVVRKSLEELFGITEQVYLIPNSVDIEKIERLSRAPISLPDKKIFTTLGRLDYNKNQMLLLKAIRLVKKQRQDFMVYLLGEGEERQALEAYIQENGLEEQVCIPGFVDNPYPYIKNSLATILTSFSEGFSLVLVESAILDTPVISTDVGVARELTEKYNCGDLISYDEDELAAVMLRYLNTYEGIRQGFGIGAEYDIKIEVKKTEELIDGLLKEEVEPSRLKKLPYPEVTIHEDELEDYQIQPDRMFILRVRKNGVPYEYLINRRSANEKLIVFHNGAVAGGNVTVPVFQRHSWAANLKTSAVFCMDPTLYLSTQLQLGWGMGKNEDYYLENSCRILEKIIQKMGIQLKDTVIYGTSAGGYLSILTGIYLKGAKVVADNAQFDVRNWIYQDALDMVVSYCFDNIGMALKYKERFSIVDAFEKHHYVPKIYMHVNLCSDADNSRQLVPFLENAQAMKGITEYHETEVILHYEPEKGHEGLDMEEAIRFLYQVLNFV